LGGVFHRGSVLGVVGALVVACPALADPRLDEVVYSPFVQNHVGEFETRWGQELGGGDETGARTLVEEVEAGLNDRVSLSFVGQVERAPGEAERLTGVGLEGIAYVGQIPGVGVDTGLYLEYKKGAGGDDDVGEAKLLLAKTDDRFQGLLNLIVERPFGAARGEGFASYGYAASVTWRTIGTLRLGAEAFGDFGDDHRFLRSPQGAYVGPQRKWEGRPSFLPVEVDVDIGWLAAVGPARREASSQARVNLEFERRF
jgi:hypothetical protein